MDFPYDIIDIILSYMNVKCHTCYLEFNIKNYSFFKYQDKYFCSVECFDHI